MISRKKVRNKMNVEEYSSLDRNERNQKKNEVQKEFSIPLYYIGEKEEEVLLTDTVVSYFADEEVDQ